MKNNRDSWEKPRRERVWGRRESSAISAGSSRIIRTEKKSPGFASSRNGRRRRLKVVKDVETVKQS